MGIFDYLNPTSVFNNSAKQQINAAAQGRTATRNDINTNFDTGQNFLNQGQQFLGQAVTPWADYLKAIKPGFKAYGNAAGVNGAAGTLAAQQNFRASPGYAFDVGEQNKNILRNYAATGGTASGNVLTALNDRAHSMADQEWNDYVSRLSPYLGMYTQGTSGKSGAISNEAAGYGAQADLAAQRAKELAGIDTNYFNTVGSARSQAAMAPYYGGANTWNAVLGFGNLLTNAFKPNIPA